MKDFDDMVESLIFLTANIKTDLSEEFIKETLTAAASIMEEHEARYGIEWICFNSALMTTVECARKFKLALQFHSDMEQELINKISMQFLLERFLRYFSLNPTEMGMGIFEKVLDG